ncbi:MAG: Gfo/Idh/MocA family protein [Opitutaceae bacterium]
MNPIQWGILGAGGIAKKFVASARASDNANEVAAVASETKGKAAAFASELSIPKAFDSYAALLADVNISAVYIGNTHNFHYETVLQALDAGKHVLCEKPLAVNARQATEMIAKAKAKNLFLMEAMWTRFLPACRQVMDWIEEGRIGEIHQIEASFGFKNDGWPAEGRMLNPALAGGALLDMGIYPLSFASLVMGGAKPKQIQSQLALGATGVDEDDVIILNYENEVNAILRTSFKFNLDTRATVSGSLGRITLPHVFIGQTEVRLETKGEEIIKHFPMPEAHGFRFEIEHAADCIRQGIIDSPIMPLAETLTLAETMDSIRAQWNFQYPFE